MFFLTALTPLAAPRTNGHEGRSVLATSDGRGTFGVQTQTVVRVVRVCVMFCRVDC